MRIRFGMGYDVHRLADGRRLILGGVEVPFRKGLLGHSDADVLCHALADALLGAAALGDIGQHFPNTDPRYKDAVSLRLLEEVATLLRSHRFAITNVDSTVLLEEPKLAPYIPRMRENIAACLGIPVDRVSVKATTGERLGFVGSGEGAAAYAVASVTEDATVGGFDPR